MDRLKQLEPEYLYRRERRLLRGAGFGALAVTVLCVLVFLTWALRAVPIAAAFPWLLEMKPNSALGFGAAGVALLCLVQGRPLFAGWLALVPLSIGLATLAEYASPALSIDQIALGALPSLAGAYPGRPSPSTVATLILFGGMLLAQVSRGQGHVLTIAVRLACFAIISVAMAALAGRIGHSPFAVREGVGRMSIPSALCAFVLGASMLAYGWRSETSVIASVPIWVPALLCFGLAILDVSTPLDLNIGICYIPLVFCALWFSRANVVFGFAAISTVLIFFGLFASPPGQIPFQYAAINRGLSAMAVWLAAILVYFEHAAQKKLRRTTHHLESIQKIAAIGSFELYFANMTFEGSDAFDAMHGLGPSDSRDWGSFIRRFIPPDERDSMAEMVEAARGGARSRDLEYGFLRADGAARIALLHCDLLLDPGGRPAGVIGVVHDVTELRNAQAQQADIEVQLRHAQKLEALGTLAGGIAHDLNNTLVPITTLTPLLIEGASASDGRGLEIIMGAARRAKQLVREMLVFSRKDVTAHEAIRLDLLVRDSLTIIRAGLPASIAISDELETVPEISGSKGQIYQTILNLATNAAHAIGDRAGTITIGVNCDTGADRPQVRLYVVDDGAGMDEETRERVFEPFFSTKEAHQGTGLGLSIVNGIVKSHGASIAVASTLGRSTRFDLLFPVRDVEAAA